MGRKSDARERLTKAAIEMIWKGNYGEITIDSLYESAQVNKGSFYYFFNSKPDLVHAAIAAWWEERRSLMEKMFRPEIPPLERIFGYIAFIAESQIQGYEANGYIRGAPVFRLGSEIAIHHEPLRQLVSQFINCHVRYFEEAIKEARASGQVEAGDAALKARLIWGYHLSTLTRAHVEQNPELIRNLGTDVRRLITSPLFSLDLDPQKGSDTDVKSPAPMGSEISPRGIEAEGKKQKDKVSLPKHKPTKKRSKK